VWLPVFGSGQAFKDLKNFMEFSLLAKCQTPSKRRTNGQKDASLRPSVRPFVSYMEFDTSLLFSLFVSYFQFVYFLFTAGLVIHTLRKGEPVWGVTSVDNLLYVLREKRSQQISVYDVDDLFALRRCLTVPDLRCGDDIVACAHHRCLYIPDWKTGRVHKVGLTVEASLSSWLVGDQPGRLSVTGSHSVLVTCCCVGKIKEFSTDGKLLRQIQLPRDTNAASHTWHGITKVVRFTALSGTF